MKKLNLFLALFGVTSLQIIAAPTTYYGEMKTPDSGFYLGADWAASHMVNYNIPNANAGFGDLKIGWKINKWIELEHRHAIGTYEDEIVKWDLRVGQKSYEGSYLKLILPMKDFDGYLSLGKVKMTNYAIIPEFSANPGLLDLLFSLVDPHYFPPTDLKNQQPGEHIFSLSSSSVGLGFEGAMDEDGKWGWDMGYERLGKVNGWKFSNYYIGIKRFF